MPQSRTLDVGMDVPQESIAVASGATEQGAAGSALGTCGPRPCARDTLMRKRPSQATPRVVVSDAGPWGSGLARALTNQDDVCWVVAPSWMPTKAGDRITTDRRDARPWARRMRAGDRPPVSVPAVDEAALRALRRARAATRRALQAATRRLTAVVLRPERRAPGRAPWRPAPRRGRREGGCPTPAPPRVLPADVQPGPAQRARLGRRALARHAPGTPWRCAPGGEALQARRGVPVPVAVTPVAARGDLPRVGTPRPRRPALGLTPSASSRGGRRHQGGRTTPGPPQARRARVAGAWAARSPAQGSRPLPRRLAQRPAAIHARRGQAQVRRCPRARPPRATGTQATPGGGALARACRACRGARATQGAGAPHAASGRCGDAPVRGCHPVSAETQPRCGGTLGGVLRPQGPRVPRWRQAADGGKEGGPQPTERSGSTRRVFLAPALPREQGKKHDADGKKLLPTLDLGSHINATRQARLEAEAKRKL